MQPKKLIQTLKRYISKFYKQKNLLKIKMMKKNMGSIDKATQFVIAIAIAILHFMNIISGTVAIVLGILAIAFLLTSFISFCPLYLPFGINILKKKK